MVFEGENNTIRLVQNRIKSGNYEHYTIELLGGESCKPVIRVLRNHDILV